MKKCCPLLLLCFLVLPCLAQQGDEGLDRARRVFHEQYRFRRYPRVKGPIHVSGAPGSRRVSDGRDTLWLPGVDEPFTRLFADGTLPAAVNGQPLRQISGFQEVPPATLSPRHRRFLFLAYDARRANPSQYVCELSNRRATRDTPLPEFLGGATLTFIQRGWALL